VNSSGQRVVKQTNTPPFGGKRHENSHKMRVVGNEIPLVRIHWTFPTKTRAVGVRNPPLWWKKE